MISLKVNGKIVGTRMAEWNAHTIAPTKEFLFEFGCGVYAILTHTDMSQRTIAPIRHELCSFQSVRSGMNVKFRPVRRQNSFRSR